MLHKEEQIILRVPPALAVALEKWLVDPRRAPQKFRVEIFNDGTGVLFVDQRIYRGKLANLPTIIESQRTFDGTTFYKSADINQVFVVEGGEGVDVNLYESDLKSLYTAAGSTAPTLTPEQRTDLTTGDPSFRDLVVEYPDGAADLDSGLSVTARKIRSTRFERTSEPEPELLDRAIERINLVEAEVCLLNIFVLFEFESLYLFSSLSSSFFRPLCVRRIPVSTSMTSFQPPRLRPP